MLWVNHYENSANVRATTAAMSKNDDMTTRRTRASDADSVATNSEPETVKVFDARSGWSSSSTASTRAARAACSALKNWTRTTAVNAPILGVAIIAIMTLIEG